jgi:threonine/homoserine/homoserine lactone efflux protein
VDALVLGLSIGLAAGVSPGPLLVLVVTATLRSGLRAGVLTSCAPLVTDVVVVALTLLVLDRLPHRALAVLGVAGAAFLVWTGVQTIREARSAPLAAPGHPATGSSLDALRRASVVNLLSPHPWISWATALGPLTIATWRDEPRGAVWLVGGFYLTLVGAKIAVAALVARGRRRLDGTAYRRALTAAGALLVLAGVGLAAEFGPASA